MSETLRLPVLPLDDTVVLPTMVVPLDTSLPRSARRSRRRGCRRRCQDAVRRQAAGAAGAAAGWQVPADRHARRGRAESAGCPAASPPR